MTTESTWIDTLAFVVTILRSCVPDVWIADVLPPPEQFELPAVRVDLLAGDEVHPWGDGGPIQDRVTLDIDVFAASRAEATPVATRIRQALHSLPTIAGSPVRVVDAGPFSTRPDLNPNIRRLGADVDLVVDLRT